MNIDDLVDQIVMRLNPQAKNTAHRDNQGNAHLYPKRDMYAQGIIPRMSVQGYDQGHQPCGIDTRLGGETMKLPNADIQGCCH